MAPRELTQAEAIDELCSLNGTNGWGVSEHRPDVSVRLETLVDAVVDLVGRYGTYPLAKSKKSDDYWLLIVRERSGNYSLFQRYEASMLNFKIRHDEFESIRQCARVLVSTMFDQHINGIRVLRDPGPGS